MLFHLPQNAVQKQPFEKHLEFTWKKLICSIEDQLERSQKAWVSDDAESGEAASSSLLFLPSLPELCDLYLGPDIGPFLRPFLSSLPLFTFFLGHVQLAMFSSLLPCFIDQREEFTFWGSILEESHQFFSVSCLLTKIKYQWDSYQMQAPRSLGWIHVSLSLPWRYSSKYNSQDMAVITISSSQLIFFISSLGLQQHKKRESFVNFKALVWGQRPARILSRDRCW